MLRRSAGRQNVGGWRAGGAHHNVCPVPAALLIFITPSPNRMASLALAHRDVSFCRVLAADWRRAHVNRLFRV